MATSLECEVDCSMAEKISEYDSSKELTRLSVTSALPPPQVLFLMQIRATKIKPRHFY